MTKTEEIRRMLFAEQDEKYGDFNHKLLPGIERERVIGVRTPAMRRLAKQLARDEHIGEFLQDLPHYYVEENNLHGFIISDAKDFPLCISQVEQMLPYIDNWGTCDQLSPQCFKKHRPELLPYINRWLQSNLPYTIRFSIKMLMDHFLDEDFLPEYLQKVASIRSEHYYVRMMQAWYFATALAKQWDAALPYVESRDMSRESRDMSKKSKVESQEQGLDEWTRRKAIQKARESYRITQEQKDYLQLLK